jgi:hypothetical protein
LWVGPEGRRECAAPTGPLELFIVIPLTEVESQLLMLKKHFINMAKKSAKSASPPWRFGS